MFTVNNSFLRTCCLASVLFFTSFQGYALTIKIGNSHNPNTPTTIAIDEFTKAIEEKTNGDIKFQVFNSGVLGSETEMINQLRAGVLDMVRTAPTDLEKFNSTYSALLLPYLFDNNDVMYKAMAAVEDDILNSKPELGFKGLVWNESGARSFYTANKKIEKPEDLNGLKIRVPNSQSIARTVELLGGTPTPIPLGELYTAMQQGIVDGGEGNPLVLTDMKLSEIVKHFSYDMHFLIPDVLIISTKTWDALSEEQKKIFEDESVVYNQRVKTLVRAGDLEAIEQTKDTVEYIDVDISLFREKVAPMYEELKKSNPEAYAIVERIKKAQEE